MERYIIYLDGDIYSKRTTAYNEPSFLRALSDNFSYKNPTYPVGKTYYSGREPKYYTSKKRAENGLNSLSKDISFDDAQIIKVTLSKEEEYRISNAIKKRTYIKTSRGKLLGKYTDLELYIYIKNLFAEDNKLGLRIEKTGVYSKNNKYLGYKEVLEKVGLKYTRDTSVSAIKMSIEYYFK